MIKVCSAYYYCLFRVSMTITFAKDIVEANKHSETTFTIGILPFIYGHKYRNDHIGYQQ